MSLSIRGRRRWDHRLTLADDGVRTREEIRAHARSTRMPCSPRGRGPVSRGILCLAIRLREKDLREAAEHPVDEAGAVQGDGLESVLPRVPTDAGREAPGGVRKLSRKGLLSLVRRGHK